MTKVLREDMVGETPSVCIAPSGARVLRARKLRIRRLLNMRLWKQLKAQVYDYHPDVIIYLARKMPRVAEALGWKFGVVELVVSDFALPWVAERLQGKRVAVIDDTVCRGTTLGNACRKVLRGAPKEVRAFALAVKKGYNQGQFRATYGVDLTVSGAPLPSDAYSFFSHKLARAIGWLRKPYEVEFPVFVVDYADGIGPVEILELLWNTFGFEAVQDISKHRIYDYGLGRISVDINTDSYCNYKFRLYLDDVMRKASFVPMATGLVGERASSVAAAQLKLQNLVSIFFKDDIKTEARVEQFFTSLNFGVGILPALGSVFDLKSVCLDVYDTSMLFGNDAARKICNMNIRSLLHDSTGAGHEYGIQY